MSPATASGNGATRRQRAASAWSPRSAASRRLPPRGRAPWGGPAAPTLTDHPRQSPHAAGRVEQRAHLRRGGLAMVEATMEIDHAAPAARETPKDRAAWPATVLPAGD